MQLPEKRYGIGVSPLRVLIDPTALPRDAFEVHREAGLLISIAEVGFAAAAIYLAVSTHNPEVGVLLYIATRFAAAASTYISRQMKG